MATPVWTGNAAAVQQIYKATAANTWAAADTAIITINGKPLTVTIGATNFTPADVAKAVRDAFNASTRLTGTNSNTDATSNFGGQEFGEFTKIEAFINEATEPTVVYFRAKPTGNVLIPYYPFTLAASETTFGTGTLAGASVQAATGPNHWDNVLNWSTGSAPVSDDTVVFKDSAVPVLYGLPNATLEVTLQVYQSFTGSIGLPVVNTDDQQKPYHEYRQRFVRLDDAGGGSDIAHRFGIGGPGSGSGSPLINLKHSTLQRSPVVYATGTPQIAGTKALNIVATANTSTLTIYSGSVDFSSADGGTSAFATVNIGGGVTGSAPNVRAVGGMKSGGELIVSAGNVYMGENPAYVLSTYGGTTRIENQAIAFSTVGVQGGVVQYVSPADITTLLILAGGVFDMTEQISQVALDDVTLYGGGTFRDPNGQMLLGTQFTIKAHIAAVTIDLGPDFTIGA